MLVTVARASSSSAAGKSSARDQAGADQASDSADGTGNCEASVSGSPYIPVDSWIYPAVMRLYALGFLDHIYLGMRPWTWSSLGHMLEDTQANIESAEEGPVTDEARRLYEAVNRDLQRRNDMQCSSHAMTVQLESTYSIMRGISGIPLDDSYHLGQTIVNDYGRPYENGFNNYSGASGWAVAWRFALYARGEFQRAGSATGYSSALAQTLSTIDVIPFINPVTGLPYQQQTIPLGPILATTQGRFLEAYVSANLMGHEISFGKQDDWLGPGIGGGMAYSNNAENIYSFRINRIEPLYVPLLSRLTGPFRYDFLVGKLRGHTYVPNSVYAADASLNKPQGVSPGDPWVHVEKFSFRPTSDLEFGFERTVIWGGEGHEPITLHTFLKSFFSTNSTFSQVKFSRQDPGARFGAFDFTYRLPYPHNLLTLYSDFEAHDAPNPIAKPLHGTFRPGLYLSYFPGLPKLDLRVEGVDTDSPYPASVGGLYQYWEQVQVQGYTNNGQLFGDWAGREDKGGQAWLTYHLSGNEWIEAGWRHQKAAKDFIEIPAVSATATTSAIPAVEYGTTLNDFGFQVVKRIGEDFELNGSFTLERWKAPIYLPGQQTVTTTTIQLTWFPERKLSF